MPDERLSEIRKEYKQTQYDLAKALDVGVQTVRSREQGRNYPPGDKLMLICELYGTSADCLLGLSDYDPSGEARRRKRSMTKDELAALHDYEKLLIGKRKPASWRVLLVSRQIPPVYHTFQ